MSSQNFTKTNVSGRQASTACTLPNLKFFSRQAVKEHPVLRKLTFAASQIIGKVGSLLPFAAVAHEITAKSEGERRQCGQINSY
ncbi:MAG: hypothetical protein ACJA2X_000154 [Halocynthiibacter sp.]|jgi:hypothetical protein